MADVFDVGNGVPANFNDGTIEVSVNGSSKGRQRTLAGEHMGAFLKRMAQTYGVRTFSAYATYQGDDDQTKLDTSNSNDELNDVNKISIVAKDSRGGTL